MNPHEDPLAKGPDPVEWAERDEEVRKIQEKRAKEQEARAQVIERQRAKFEERKRELAEHLHIDVLRFPGASSWFDGDGFNVEAGSFDGTEVHQILLVAQENNCEVECWQSEEVVVFTLKPRE